MSSAHTTYNACPGLGLHTPATPFCAHTHIVHMPTIPFYCSFDFIYCLYTLLPGLILYSCTPAFYLLLGCATHYFITTIYLRFQLVRSHHYYRYFYRFTCTCIFSTLPACAPHLCLHTHTLLLPSHSVHTFFSVCDSTTGTLFYTYHHFTYHAPSRSHTHRFTTHTCSVLPLPSVLCSLFPVLDTTVCLHACVRSSPHCCHTVPVPALPGRYRYYCTFTCNFSPLVRSTYILHFLYPTCALPFPFCTPSI